AEISSLRRQHGRKSLPCWQLRAAIRLNLSVRPRTGGYGESRQANAGRSHYQGPASYLWRPWLGACGVPDRRVAPSNCCLSVCRRTFRILCREGRLVRLVGRTRPVYRRLDFQCRVANLRRAIQESSVANVHVWTVANGERGPSLCAAQSCCPANGCCPGGRGLTMRSSRNSIATPATWQKELAMCPATRRNSA